MRYSRQGFQKYLPEGCTQAGSSAHVVKMLGIAEFCIPGKSLEEKLKEIEGKFWLELVNRGNRYLDALENFKIETKTVQAYLLRDLHLLSRDSGTRKSAFEHAKDTIEVAGRVGAENIITAIYGYAHVKEPFKKCVEIFKNLSEYADECGINILIEPLSKKRTSFLPSLLEMHSLIRAIDEENVHMAADTYHIHGSGEDVIKTIKNFRKDIVEIQLRDTSSKPPGMGGLDFKEILKMKKLFCLEYRSKSIKKDFEYVCRKFVHNALNVA